VHRLAHALHLLHLPFDDVVDLVGLGRGDDLGFRARGGLGLGLGLWTGCACGLGAGRASTGLFSAADLGCAGSVSVGAIFGLAWPSSPASHPFTTLDLSAKLTLVMVSPSAALRAMELLTPMSTPPD